MSTNTQQRHEFNRQFQKGIASNHAIVTTNCGTYCWGRNDYGQLGLPHCNNVNTPQKLQLNATSVACSCFHSLILTKQGLFIYGKNGTSQHHQFRSENVTDITCGYTHFMVLSTEGLFVWGGGGEGQLGLGDTVEHTIPQRLISFSPSDILRIACGAYYSLVHTKRGLYVWGRNKEGQLGLGHNHNQLTPALVTRFQAEDIRDVSCGTHRLMILHREEGLYATGYNLFGQLGLGHNKNQNTFQRIALETPPHKVVGIAASESHSMVLTTDALYVWGWNNEGQLGLQHGINQNAPQLLTLFDAKRVVGLACGYSHSMVLTKDGVFVWGRNTDGQLGLGHNNNETTPQRLQCFTYDDFDVRRKTGKKKEDPLYRAFEDVKYANVEATVEGETFRLHRALVTYHCPSLMVSSPPPPALSTTTPTPTPTSPFATPPAASPPLHQGILLPANTTADVFRHVVRFIHTMTLSRQIDPVDLVRVLRCAIDMPLVALHSLCLSRLVLSFTPSNIMSLLVEANKNKMPSVVSDAIVWYIAKNKLVLSEHTINQLIPNTQLISLILQQCIRLTLPDPVVSLALSPAPSLSSPFPFSHSVPSLLDVALHLFTSAIHTDFNITLQGTTAVVPATTAVASYSTTPPLPSAASSDAVTASAASSSSNITLSPTIIKTHKFVLAPQWPYYEHILLNSGTDGALHSTRMPHTTFHKMVSFFYSRSPKELLFMDCGWILSHAGYYLLDECDVGRQLVEYCDKVVNEETEQNWFDLLRLGVELEDEELKKRGLEKMPGLVDGEVVRYFVRYVKKVAMENALLRKEVDDLKRKT